MKQALHIFAKDARHFWPEILVSVAITAVFAWIYPNYWKAQINPSAMEIRNLQQLASLILLLVPVSWWVLITRVVLGEALVGDQQWWVTKPYEWPQLLGAKLLFLAAFVLLPFSVAQCVLLEEAGFRWVEYLPGLGLNLVLTAGVLLVPLLVLATVTSGFGKMVLTLLGLLLSFIILLVIAARGGADSFSPYGDRLSIPILLVFGGAAVVLQYARRMTRRSRWLLVAAGVLLIVAGTLSSAPGPVAMAYPAHPGSKQYQVTYDTTVHYSPPNPRNSRRVSFFIPLAVSGIAEGAAITIDGVRATFEAPDGKRWTSSWQSVNKMLLLGDASQTTKTGLPVEIDRGFFDGEQSQKLNLHLELAIRQLKAGEDRTYALGRGEFAVPDVGICAPMQNWTSDGFEIAGVACRSAMRNPKFTFVSVRWAESHCGAGSEDFLNPGSGGTTVGDLSGDPADFGITSVWSSPVYLGSSDAYASSTDGKSAHHRFFLCPGSPVHFTRYTATGRTQIGATLPDFQLPDWKGSQTGMGR